MEPVYLLHIGFDGYDLNAWTGQGDLSFDSKTWKGEGVVLEWPSVKESVELEADNITLTLDGNYSYPINITDPDLYRARTCEIYIGFLDDVGALLATNVYQVFSGKVSTVGLSEDTVDDTFSVSAESRLVDLSRAKVSTYTNESQLQDFPLDKGLEYATTAQTKLFISRGDTITEPQSKKIIYGRNKVEGTVVFIGTSGSGSRYLNLVVAFAGHECESIDQVYLDDRPLLTNGAVSGEFAGVVAYYQRLGFESQPYISQLATEVGTGVWTSSHQLNGICYAYMRILYSEDLFGNDAPAVSAVIKGKKIDDTRTQASIDLTSPDFEDAAGSYWNLTTEYGTSIDGLILYVDGSLNSNVVFYLDGTDGYARLFIADRTGMTQGIAVRRLYSDNPALVINDFLMDDIVGFGSPMLGIDSASVSAAATDCDFLVAKKDTNTEKRYTCNGVLDTADSIGQNAQKILDTMFGQLSYLGGVFAVYSGSYSLTGIVGFDDDFLSALVLDNRNLRDSYNGAKGSYKTELLDWRDEEYPEYQLASGVTIDGEERWLANNLPLVTSPSTAQRLAKIKVMRSRAVREVTFESKLTLLNVRSGDTIALSTAKNEVDNFVYKVRSMELNMALEPTLSFDMIEVVASDYDWDAATEEKELSIPASTSDSILSWTLARLNLPSVSPASKSSYSAFNVTAYANETGVTIRYTTDGTEPTTSSSTVANGGSITINQTLTLKLKTFQDGGTLTSNVATYDNFTITVPTQLVPTPTQDWNYYYSTSWVDTQARNRYAVNLSGCRLYATSNGGTSWTLLSSNTNAGQYYTHGSNITTNFTPSNYRAYATKVGYVDSNQFVLPNKCIPMFLCGERSQYNNVDLDMGMQGFHNNATYFFRYRTRSKSGNSWGSWSGYASWSGNGFKDIIGASYPNKNLETQYTDYEWEVYCQASGFSDSVLRGATSYPTPNVPLVVDTWGD